MMKNRVLLTAVLLLLSAFQIAGEEDLRILINSGHSMPITTLEYDDSRDILVTASEDGTFRIWNPDNGSLLYNKKVSRNPIRLAALHPEKPQAALVTSDNLNSFVLMVYDWETDRVLYTIKLQELPLFLKYSPAGSYIVYGITNWQSLSFIESESGTFLPYLTEGFGIVSSAFISASEKTILTYSPSGYIQYWGVEDGTLKKRVPTIPNLENTTFTDNGRYMAASNDGGIMLIDLVSGSPVSDHELEDIDFLAFTPDYERLYAYSRTARGYLLSVYEHTRNRLILSARFSNLEIRKLDGFTAENGKLFMADAAGEIQLFNTVTEALSLFAGSSLYSISDAAMNDEGLLLVSEENMLLIDPEIFTDFQKISEEGPIIETFPVPFEGSPGIEVLDRDEFLLYTSQGSAGTLAAFSPTRGVTQLFDGFPYAFSEINYQDGRALTLDKNGGCMILNFQTGETEFEFTSFGLRTVCFTPEGNILGGRSMSSGIQTPLLHINTTTGETVDIEENNRLTSHLSFDPASGSIYSIGIEERRSRLRTVLRKHDPDQINRSETLLTALGENLDASMLIEEGGTRIFTSLNDGGVNMLYWGGFTPFEETGDTLQKMLLLDNYLIGLNAEGSLTFWNKASGEELFTFYLFKDLNWAAVFPDDTILTSPEGDDYLSIYSGTSRFSQPVYRYRRKL